MDRRKFVKLVGGASSAAFVGACGVDKGTEYLIPHVIPPDEEIIPGTAVYYGTTCTECPAGCGIRAKVRDGRPVKLEGLPGHPINDGRLCIRGQASLTRLYHPDRIKTPMSRVSGGEFRSVSWEEALDRIAEGLREAGSSGLRSAYLPSRRTGASSDILDLFCRRMGVRRLPGFEIYSHSAIREANGMLFGRREVPFYDIENCDFLLTVGADILETFVSPVSYAVQLSRAKSKTDLTWLHFEPHLSLTGLQADGRFVLHPGGEALLLAFLLGRIASSERSGRVIPRWLLGLPPRPSEREVSEKTGLDEETLEKAARGLERSRSPLLIVGGVSTGHERGLEAAFLAGVIQWITGMVGSTVSFNRAEEYGSVGSIRDLDDFVGSMGDCGVLFLSDVDPVSLAPNPEGLREGMRGLKLKVALSDFMNPTAKECDLVLPTSHSLESWGAAAPRRGITSIIRPAIDPIHDTRTEGDILLGIMLAASAIKRLRTFRSYLTERLSSGRPLGFLEELVSVGYHQDDPNTAEPRMDEAAASRFVEDINLEPGLKPPLLVLTPSIRAFDGRSAVLPLMQEIPDPVTTISYGRWIGLSETEASRLGLKDGDEIQASSPDSSLTAPVKTVRGLPEGIYVFQRWMPDAPPVAFDPRTGEAACYVEERAISKTGASFSLPIMSGSMSQHDRGIIPRPNHRQGGRAGVHGGHEGHGEDSSMYPEVEHSGHRWAMAIDLDLCIGCSACVAACYLENNVPVVGLEEHLKGREMSWLRVEPYYNDDAEQRRPGVLGGMRGAARAAVSFIPMLCQHCTYAPCESVCPVYAAYHTPQGLNAQVYNRCVGTRYCSNNCPYKVRRFNWFTHKPPEPMDRMLNPDIFTRGKGVMEKCTFCVQRINAARDAAKDESREIRDGEIVPACAQTCPTGAIVFGDLLDESSAVYELAHSERAYTVFEHLGTEPGVYYLSGRKKEI